jgi:predicted RNase H-like HicB family nuclease
MKKTITAILERGKDGYGVMFEEFPDVFSFGITVEEAKVNAREAIELFFEGTEKPPVWLEEGFEIAVTFMPFPKPLVANVPAFDLHY